MQDENFRNLPRPAKFLRHGHVQFRRHEVRKLAQAERRVVTVLNAPVHHRGSDFRSCRFLSELLAGFATTDTRASGPVARPPESRRAGRFPGVHESNFRRSRDRSASSPRNPTWTACFVVKNPCCDWATSWSRRSTSLRSPSMAIIAGRDGSQDIAMAWSTEVAPGWSPPRQDSPQTDR